MYTQTYDLAWLQHERRLGEAKKWRLYRQAMCGRPPFRTRLRMYFGALLHACGNRRKANPAGPARATPPAPSSSRPGAALG